MNYLILITVVASLIIILKCARTIVKAAKRINLLYDYFIVNGKATPEDLQVMAKSLQRTRPNPNDGSGCPREADLDNEI